MEKLSDLLQMELGAGEKLLWSGQSVQGLRLRGYDVFLIPFGLLWMGFIVLAMLGISGEEFPLFICFWFIPFLLMGLYLLIGRFFADAWQRSHTLYALTDQRALIVTTMGKPKVKSLILRNLPQITLVAGAQGRGSIVFGNPNGMAWWYKTFFFGPGLSAEGFTPPEFEEIENVRDVYRQIQLRG
jgi:hypothetical protein